MLKHIIFGAFVVVAPLSGCSDNPNFINTRAVEFKGLHLPATEDQILKKIPGTVCSSRYLSRLDGTDIFYAPYIIKHIAAIGTGRESDEGMSFRYCANENDSIAEIRAEMRCYFGLQKTSCEEIGLVFPRAYFNTVVSALIEKYSTPKAACDKEGKCVPDIPLNKATFLLWSSPNQAYQIRARQSEDPGGIGQSIVRFSYYDDQNLDSSKKRAKDL